ncbi:MAG: hypothetical protein GTO14_04685, partial [Anaerolineales bacterium]|nr:hypothetical protein [Anaerolineales bacterium]
MVFAQPDTTTLGISVFGPIILSLDEKPIRGMASDKVRALLIYLAVESDRPHRRDALAELFWPDRPQGVARNNLKQALANLRKSLRDRDSDAPYLLVSRNDVQFNVESDHRIDVFTFRDHMSAAEKHTHQEVGFCNQCVEHLRQAVDIYHGDFLEEFSLPDSKGFEEWALLNRETFRRRMANSLRKLVALWEQQGSIRQARQFARRLVKLEPWNEGNHRVLIRLLAVSGRRSEALRQYQACERVLAEEFGVEPTKETTSLYESIRSGVRDELSTHISPPSDKGSLLPELLEKPVARSFRTWIAQIPRWVAPATIIILVGSILLTWLGIRSTRITGEGGGETIPPIGVGDETGERVPSYAAGETRWYVSTTGNDNKDCRTPETACASINGALRKQEFTAGDTVFVAGGRYTGTGAEVALLLHDVTLAGGWNADFSSQDSISTIDGEGVRRCMTVHSGVIATVERFSLQHGSSTNGAGILNGGTLTLDQSSVQGNSAANEGGGVSLQREAVLILNKSTISENVAVSGGGIFNAWGTLHGHNSTISSNTAEGGGGINNLGGVVYLNSCTVGFNNVSPMGGGGIRNEADGVVTLQNTILAGNKGHSPDCNGSILSSGYNLVGNTSDCVFHSTTGDLVNVEPYMSALNDHGGLTLTHGLLLESPAIDAGNPALPASEGGACEADDQRGVARPIDGDSSGGSRCDIGAYELDTMVAIQPTPLSDSEVKVHLNERETLVTLYQATDGDNWTNASGWLSSDTPCNWYGVTCVAGSVTELRLGENGMKGTLPEELAKLSNLKILDLQGNLITGAIPPELGELKNLVFLDLSFNHLQGPIPLEISELENLNVLVLDGNNLLSGPIPPELGNLRNLDHLILSSFAGGTQLSGTIPTQFGNLSKLTWLELANALVSGPIPPEL